MNTKPIGKAIREAANEFEHKAQALRDLSLELESTGDIHLAATAISICSDMQNVRTDQITREAVRALQRELIKD